MARRFDHTSTQIRINMSDCEFPSGRATVIRSKLVAKEVPKLKRLSRGPLNNHSLDNDVARIESRTNRSNGLGSWRGKAGSRSAISEHAMAAIRCLTQVGTTDPDNGLPRASEALWHVWCAAELVNRPAITVVLEGIFSAGLTTVLNRLGGTHKNLKSCVIPEPKEKNLKQRKNEYKKNVGNKRFTIWERSPMSIEFANSDATRDSVKPDDKDVKIDLVIIIASPADVCLARNPKLTQEAVNSYHTNLNQLVAYAYPHAEIVSVDGTLSEDQIFLTVLDVLRYFCDDTISEII